MKKEIILNIMSLILTEEEMNRINVEVKNSDKTIINLDLHGLGCKQAKRLVKNVISVNRGPFLLNAIHGFNHGTALKTMVNSIDLGERVVYRSSPKWNPGQTFIKIGS